MPSRHTRTRVYVAIVVTIALGFLLPPTVNLNYFRGRLSQSLSRSLGRQVSIQDVHLRLLPMPGFTFRRLQISDDDEFGGEPILQTAEDDGQNSAATLRLTSLWQGRLEIASVSLTRASLNLARAPDGHWNLERLINRAAQVPSAPTSKKKAESRARFPYIELQESRINFKFGAEKKPFALSEAEFALWLAAENRWNVRLKAVPLRTDESISDTGVIRISGSFDRADQFSRTPFHFQTNWERAEVSAITRIARGHDAGWRGTVDLDGEFKGTPGDFTARLNANIDEFRRYDIARPASFDVRVSCNQRFRAEATESTVADQLGFQCKVPFEAGMLTAEGEVHPLGKSPDFSVRLFASQVPISTLVRAILHAKSTLPDDLTGDGVIDGGWFIERTAGSPIMWQGAVTASKAVLRSQALGPSLIFSRPVVVDFLRASSSIGAKPTRKAPLPAAVSRAVIEPFTLNIGGDVQVSAAFDPNGYRLDVNGPVDWQRLMQIARTIGLHPPPNDLQGMGVLTAQYSGEWRRFGPPIVTGQAQIRSAAMSLRGFSEPLRVSSGTLKFDGPSFSAERIDGVFPRSGFAFVGNFSGTRECERHIVCNVSFSLQTDDLREAALVQLLSPPSSAISLPFFNSGRQFEARWLLEVPANGSIAAQLLTIRKFQAKNVAAQLQVADGKVLVRHWTGDFLGGRHDGESAFDFSAARPAITATGSLQHAQMERMDDTLDQQVGTGLFDLDYRLTMSGISLDQLAASASGSGQFAWHDGTMPTVRAEGEHSPPLGFSAWTGHFTLAQERIALENTKMTSTSGVREVSGEISFSRQWNLKFVRANGSGFVASGSLGNPTILYEPAKLAEARH